MIEDFEVSSGNVFADLEFEDSEQELMKAELTLQIYRLLKARRLTQTEAAKLLRTTQPQISALMRCKPVSVSVGRLMEFLTVLGQDVEVVVKPAAEREKSGRLSVVFEPRTLGRRIDVPRPSRSQETRISRFPIKAIMKTVDILDRRGGQFLGINVVEQRNLNRVENTPQGFHFTAPRRADAAYFAEMKLDRRAGSTRGRPLVVRLGRLASGETIAAGWDNGEPGTRLSAA
jgi:predicted XRE-type DNA-binding protein